MNNKHGKAGEMVDLTQEGERSVVVESSGRLHMGFFDLNGGLGRKFGSVGLSLAEPSIQLTAKKSNALTVHGDKVADDILLKSTQITAQFVAEFKLPTTVHIEINRFVPAHAGLGSGTQLALTIGAAINRLFSLNLTTQDIAMLTGRGGRSGIGIAAFDHGGLLVDGGRSATSTVQQSVPPLLARYDFPEDWRILLIFDHAAPGIHGDEEKMAFDALPIFPESLAATLCRQVLMRAMPAIIEQDLVAFGESIQAIQTCTGDYFSPAQGGRYASLSVSKVLDFLKEDGVACFGQSSWGPTGFAVFESDQLANQYLTTLSAKYHSDQLSFMVTRALNTGANVFERKTD